MTPQEIIDRLFVKADPNRADPYRHITLDRVQKAKGTAMRSNLEWSAVLAAMTDAQRKAVEDAG
jgi:hypothetical protein